jgi:hypothetical protein
VNPEFGWHYVGDGEALSHAIWRVAFHELAVLEDNTPGRIEFREVEAAGTAK